MDYQVDICVSKLIYFSIFLLQCRFTSLPRILPFHFRNVTFVTSSEKSFEFVLCTFSNIGLFQKKNKQGKGLRTWNFQGYRRSRRRDFQKNNKFSRGDKHKNWKIHQPWFLVLEFSRGVVNTTSHYRNSQNEALFCPELLRIK